MTEENANQGGPRDVRAVMTQEIMTGIIIDNDTMLGITIVIPQNPRIQLMVNHDGHIDHHTTVGPKVEMILNTGCVQFELDMRPERSQVIPGTPRMITWMVMEPERSIMRRNSSDMNHYLISRISGYPHQRNMVETTILKYLIPG